MSSVGRRRDGIPLWVSADLSPAQRLKRVDLRSADQANRYNEAWLQKLLHGYPEVLPIAQIESGFGSLVSACRELTLDFGGGRSGALDNFYLTTTGGIALIEAKLWRNPEARRSAVAQAMEYAGAIFRLSYGELEDAVRRARKVAQEQDLSLFELIGESELDEAEFVDTVSRNLRRGRAIVALVGDGIREDIMPLAELLQSHAGHRFTFALIEMAIYEAPETGTKIIFPSILAQTTLLERGVVRIEDAPATTPRIQITDAVTPSTSSPRQRSFGIGEDEFFEILGQRDPSLPQLLKTFLTKVDALGVYPDRQGGLNLKHELPDGRPLNLGTIRKDGFVDTGPSTWFGRTHVGRTYNKALADLIGGSVQPNKSGTQSAVRTTKGTTPRLSDFLPDHEEGWLRAMERYIQDAISQADPSSR